MVADHGVAVASTGALLGEGGEWFGRKNGFTAEVQVYLLAFGLDVVECETADGGGLLRVEQDE